MIIIILLSVAAELYPPPGTTLTSHPILSQPLCTHHPHPERTPQFIPSQGGGTPGGTPSGTPIISDATNIMLALKHLPFHHEYLLNRYNPLDYLSDSRDEQYYHLEPYKMHRAIYIHKIRYMFPFQI